MILRKDDRAFTQLLPLALAVVICFAVLFIGIFVNGEINDALTKDYATNEIARSISTTSYYYNSSKAGSGGIWYWRNISLPANCKVGNLDTKYTNISFINNQTDNAASHSNVQFSFSINGNHVNQTNVAPGAGANITLAKLISNTNISTTDNHINFGFSVNSSIGRIKINYLTSSNYYAPGDMRTGIENTTYTRFGNIATNQDSTLDIVQVVIIISVLATAVAAIFLFTRFRQ